MLNNNWVSLLKLGLNQISMNNSVRDTTNALCSPYYGGIRNALNNLKDYTFTDEDSTYTEGSGTGGFFLLVGSSDSEVTPNDYCLGSALTDYLVISQSHYFNKASGTYSPSLMTLTRVIKNNTAAEITIKEVGAYYKYEGNIPYMIAREVIEPVTLQPGEKHSFTMDICVQ